MQNQCVENLLSSLNKIIMDEFTQAWNEFDLECRRKKCQELEDSLIKRDKDKYPLCLNTFRVIFDEHETRPLLECMKDETLNLESFVPIREIRWGGIE
jgi:hypothetical protein